MNIYFNIVSAKNKGLKLLAVLIDPEKIDLKDLPSFLEKIHQSIATHIFIGGSTDQNNQIELVVQAIKKNSQLPVVLFPGSEAQITLAADALLFLSLVSGRNPEYLIGQHVKAAAKLKQTTLEIIPTGYVLVDGGTETAIQRVSQTKPIEQNQLNEVIHTALASQYLGHKLVYLEAGSGAKTPVSFELIQAVKETLAIPLIVGGGIRNKKQLQQAFEAGEIWW
uniref:geranylgeranylglyceryl/heptaprenylglyceryl phosphate synthase n=1 Tax=Polaribacter sp. TaxID=1920175 RepID=UPI004047F328